MYKAMPMSVLGVFGIVGGLAVLLLPETQEAGLQDTVHQNRYLSVNYTTVHRTQD